jgi:hypothetical protein
LRYNLSDAYITIDQRFISLGSHATAEAAARAYDQAARATFGDYACTNQDLELLKENHP